MRGQDQQHDPQGAAAEDLANLLGEEGPKGALGPAASGERKEDLLQTRRLAACACSSSSVPQPRSVRPRATPNRSQTRSASVNWWMARRRVRPPGAAR